MLPGKVLENRNLEFLKRLFLCVCDVQFNDIKYVYTVYNIITIHPFLEVIDLFESKREQEQRQSTNGGEGGVEGERDS